VFIAAPAGSQISPNLAGRMAADFALYYQLYHNSNPTAANQALLYAEQIFALANTSLAIRPHLSPTHLRVGLPDHGSSVRRVWRNSVGGHMELGATELYIALQAGGSNLPSGLLVTNPTTYLTDAASMPRTTPPISIAGDEDMLNLYDVAGLAHFELYALWDSLAIQWTGTESIYLAHRSQEFNGVAVTQAGTDVWGYGRLGATATRLPWRGHVGDGQRNL